MQGEMLIIAEVRTRRSVAVVGTAEGESIEGAEGRESEMLGRDSLLASEPL